MESHLVIKRLRVSFLVRVHAWVAGSILVWAHIIPSSGVEERGYFVLLVRMKTSAATMESSVEIPQKLKMDLPFDPAIPHLGIYPKKPKTLI